MAYNLIIVNFLRKFVKRDGHKFIQKINKNNNSNNNKMNNNCNIKLIVNKARIRGQKTLTVNPI